MTLTKALFEIGKYQDLLNQGRIDQTFFEDMANFIITETIPNMKTITYEEAYREAEQQASKFKTFRDPTSGRMMIEVEGKAYPRDWFLRTCARMKANGEI